MPLSIIFAHSYHWCVVLMIIVNEFAASGLSLAAVGISVYTFTTKIE